MRSGGARPGRLAAARGRLAAAVAHGRLVVAVIALVALVVAACAGPAPSAPAGSGTAGFSLTIQDIDGPTLDVQVNGSTVARVACRAGSTAAAPVLTVATAGKLPWVVTLKTQAGSTMGQWGEDGTQGPRMLLIHGKDIEELPLSDQLGASPAPTCVPD